MSRYRVPSNHPVRRRLIFDENVDEASVNTNGRNRVPTEHQVRQRPVFDEVVAEQARFDNCANKLQELIARETETMSEKYNFDFIKEEALEGRFIWFKKDNDKWVGMKPRKSGDIDSKKDDEFSSIQADNENTPVHVKNDTVPVIRARKNIIERGGRESVKRRMDFDVSGDSRRRRH